MTTGTKPLFASIYTIDCKYHWLFGLEPLVAQQKDKYPDIFCSTFGKMLCKVSAPSLTICEVRASRHSHQPSQQSICQRGDGGGGMNWEIGIDIYTLICIK